MDPSAELLISADSHVVEPENLWADNLPQSLRDQAPRYPNHPFKWHDGGTNPAARVREMAVDGVSAEVLYPSLLMDQFGIRDPLLQEACFKIYNDWVIDYCAHAPDRLFGIATISVYRIEEAIKEVRRCKEAGLRGIMIYQVPPEELSFSSKHYEKLWATVQELEMPVNMHVNTGIPYGLGSFAIATRDGPTRMSALVNMKLLHVSTTLTQLIFSGALERYPGLKIVLVENEVSWLPFVLSQWDKYSSRGNFDNHMTMLPSEYFRRQIFATFFNDPPTQILFGKWGTHNCMWSNDFPHKNSTWPKSREVIARDLGGLPDEVRSRLLHENVAELFHLQGVTPLAA